MELLEIETIDDAIAFVTERRELSAQALQILLQMFEGEAADRLEALITERGLEIIGNGAY